MATISSASSAMSLCSSLSGLDASQNHSIHTYTPIHRSPLSSYVTDDSGRRTITFRPHNHTKKQSVIRRRREREGRSSPNLLQTFGRTLMFQEGRVVGWEELDWELDDCSEWFRDVDDVVMGDDNGGGEEEERSYLDGSYGSSTVEEDFDPWIVNLCENHYEPSDLSIPQYGDGGEEKETSNVSDSSFDTAAAIASMLCEMDIIPGFITQQPLQGNNILNEIPSPTPFIDPEAASAAQVLCSWYSSYSIGGPIWSDLGSSTSSNNINNNDDWKSLFSNAPPLSQDPLASTTFFSETEAGEYASRLPKIQEQERSMDDNENVKPKKDDGEGESVVVFEGKSQKRKREDLVEEEREGSSENRHWVEAGGRGGAKRRRLG